MRPMHVHSGNSALGTVKLGKILKSLLLHWARTKLMKISKQEKTLLNRKSIQCLFIGFTCCTASMCFQFHDSVKSILLKTVIYIQQCIYAGFFFPHSPFAFCYFAKNLSITLLYCVWNIIFWWISTSYPVCETKDLLRDYRMNEIAPSIKAASLFPVFAPRVMGGAVARYDFASRDTQELSLLQGDVIRVYTKLPNGWWKGEVDGRVGLSLHPLHRSIFPLLLWWSPLVDFKICWMSSFWFLTIHLTILIGWIISHCRKEIQ